MRRLSAITCLVAAPALWLSAQQQQPQQPTGDYTLTGTVVNAATGEPISRALVQLNGAGAMQTMMTGGDGRFSFEHLTGTGVMVFPRKPGFYTRQEAGAQPPQLYLPGRDSAIKVELLPSATITGRVTTASGDPVEQITVQVLLRAVSNGSAHWEARNATQTDDTGTYRISNLMPGKYYVRTEVHPVRRLSPGIRSYGENFDLVYPAIYFPGSSDRSGASAVNALPGQETEANISEPVAKAYTAAGTVAAQVPDPVFFLVSDAEGNPVNAPVHHKGPQFSVKYLIPGEYIISATAPAQGQQLYGSGEIGINHADTTGAVIEMTRGATIPLHFSYPGGAVSVSDGSQQVQAFVIPGGTVPVPPVPLQLRLSAESSRPGAPNEYYAQTLPGGGTAFANVRPGKYRVEYEKYNNWSATAIRFGQTDLTREPLVLSSGSDSQPIQVEVAEGSAAVKATVKEPSSTVSATLILIADSNAAMAPMVRSGSEITFTGLAPGAYHVYAFTSIAGLEYRNPEAMKLYADRCVALTLSEHETKQVEVPLIGGNSF